VAEQSLLYYAGVEVASNTRVLAYLRNTGSLANVSPNCSCIPPAAIGDEPYTTPAADPAPWYDPDEPESAGFTGVWIESIAGLSDSPYQRAVTQRLGDGAVKSRGRRASKTLTVTAWLFAVDCCSADYGLRWLTAALYSSCTQCQGNELCFLSCCPSVVEEGPQAALGPDGQWWDTPARTRHLTGAALISGPTVVQRNTGCSGPNCAGSRPMYQVQWVMDTDPCVWRRPVSVLEETMWPLPTGEEPCNITWDTACCDPYRPGCTCTGPCQGDPFCPTPQAPPVPPPAEPECVCVPLQVVRQCVDVEPDLVPTWEEASLVITVRSGSQAMRNLRIALWPNPLGRPPEDLSDCNACGMYYVTHVPANSVLTIDGRTCTASVVCPGNVTQNASNEVYGDAGGPMACVTLSCGIRYTICADADTHNVAPDASLSIGITRCEVVG
jgi:hypothetical protein